MPPPLTSGRLVACKGTAPEVACSEVPVTGAVRSSNRSVFLLSKVWAIEPTF